MAQDEDPAVVDDADTVGATHSDTAFVSALPAVVIVGVQVALAAVIFVTIAVVITLFARPQATTARDAHLGGMWKVADPITSATVFHVRCDMSLAAQGVATVRVAVLATENATFTGGTDIKGSGDMADRTTITTIVGVVFCIDTATIAILEAIAAEKRAFRIYARLTILTGGVASTAVKAVRSQAHTRFTTPSRSIASATQTAFAL